MTGNCPHCQKLFSTKNGGMLCSVCGDIACPECEATFFSQAVASQHQTVKTPEGGAKEIHNQIVEVCDACHERMGN